ncbi:MAG TPA: RebB family R body protein [bacterium]|nr:RebB family R body protein [bacterium]
MASNEAVNAQIVDAISTTTSVTVGEASSMALGMFYQVEAQAFGLCMQNAVNAQNRMNQIGEAVVGQVCSKILCKMGS